MLILSKLDNMPSQLAEGECWQQIVPELLQQGRPVVNIHVIYYHQSTLLSSCGADLLYIYFVCMLHHSRANWFTFYHQPLGKVLMGETFGLLSIGPQVLKLCPKM